MDIAFTITDDTLTRGIQRALEASVDFTPAMRSIAGLMESETRLRFETGRAPSGAPWMTSQRVLKDGGRTLVDSGQLLASISSAFDDSSAIAGTNLIYAAIHQNGGTIRPKAGKKALRTPFGPRASVNMPARPFLGFSQSEKVGTLDILSSHLAKAFAAPGAAA